MFWFLPTQFSPTPYHGSTLVLYSFCLVSTAKQTNGPGCCQDSSPLITLVLSLCVARSPHSSVITFKCSAPCYDPLSHRSAALSPPHKSSIVANCTHRGPVHASSPCLSCYHVWLRRAFCLSLRPYCDLETALFTSSHPDINTTADSSLIEGEFIGSLHYVSLNDFSKRWNSVKREIDW
jgi:hypothetical protein